MDEYIFESGRSNMFPIQNKENFHSHNKSFYSAVNEGFFNLGIIINYANLQIE